MKPDFIYRMFIDGESEEHPIDSGDSMTALPVVGNGIKLIKPGDPAYRYVVTKVVDRTDEPSSGGQPRCDVWVRRRPGVPAVLKAEPPNKLIHTA